MFHLCIFVANRVSFYPSLAYIAYVSVHNGSNCGIAYGDETTAIISGKKADLWVSFQHYLISSQIKKKKKKIINLQFAKKANDLSDDRIKKSQCYNPPSMLLHSL